MKELAKAVISVMKEVKGMEKNSNVGSGRSAYNGTKDQDVKEVFNDALAKNGLCILPIGVEEETKIDRWEEEVEWNGKKQIKQKQSVFTKVKAKYLLLHESGQSVELAGYGHGIDPQDKGAGKATTYALKNALLYTFLTPVGKIDDTETTHSNDVAVKTIVKPIDGIKLLSGCTTLKELQKAYSSLSKSDINKEVTALKDKLKLTLK
tara:strand:- start:444 stop:1064 length:621 start_codon:yes stop_codon:yes gene_type:complete